ncbi:MAG: HU family DNA-binding protein [Bdellovibrionales bacterium]|nr:HU family DNA-binding protein [Bdellovibrionales bacterium]
MVISNVQRALRPAILESASILDAGVLPNAFDRGLQSLTFLRHRQEEDGGNGTGGGGSSPEGASEGLLQHEKLVAQVSKTRSETTPLIVKRILNDPNFAKRIDQNNELSKLGKTKLQKLCTGLIRALSNAVTDALVEHRGLKIRGFGSFYIVDQTRATYIVPGGIDAAPKLPFRMVFQPSQKLNFSLYSPEQLREAHQRVDFFAKTQNTPAGAGVAQAINFPRFVDTLSGHHPAFERTKFRKEFARAFFSAVRDGLAEGHTVRLKNLLGTFSPGVRMGRSIRHPLSGEKVDAPSKLIVKYHPGRGLMNKIAAQLGTK